jgi:hypothetical protein
MVAHPDDPDKPPCSPGAADPDDDATAPQEPVPRDLFEYAFSSLVDRLTLIGDHLQAIDEHLVAVNRRHEKIAHHFHAVKHLLEKELP